MELELVQAIRTTGLFSFVLRVIGSITEYELQLLSRLRPFDGACYTQHMANALGMCVLRLVELYDWTRTHDGPGTAL